MQMSWRRCRFAGGAGGVGREDRRLPWGPRPPCPATQRLGLASEFGAAACRVQVAEPGRPSRPCDLLPAASGVRSRARFTRARRGAFSSSPATG